MDPGTHEESHRQRIVRVGPVEAFDVGACNHVIHAYSTEPQLQKVDEAPDGATLELIAGALARLRDVLLHLQALLLRLAYS